LEFRVASFSRNSNLEPRNSDDTLLSLVASVERASEHPLADAIVSCARAKGLELFDVDDFHSIPGRGVVGVVNGFEVAVGNEALMHERAVDVEPLRDDSERLAAEGKTPVFGVVASREGRGEANLSKLEPRTFSSSPSPIPSNPPPRARWSGSSAWASAS
jgi:Cu+-exporting ATPase